MALVWDFQCDEVCNYTFVSGTNEHQRNCGSKTAKNASEKHVYSTRVHISTVVSLCVTCVCDAPAYKGALKTAEK